MWCFKKKLPEVYEEKPLTPIVVHLRDGRAITHMVTNHEMRDTWFFMRANKQFVGCYRIEDIHSLSNGQRTEGK